MLRLSHAIHTILQRHQVDTIFGIPGNHNVALYRDLKTSSIRHVTARHEQGVGFMADGYARVSGRPGVCFVISGPGVTNIATALAQALGDSIPLLVIATVGDQDTRQGALHELPDQLALARSVCLEAVQMPTPVDALSWIDSALQKHRYERPGPRYIQIPLSWWAQEVELPNAEVILNPITAVTSDLENAAECLSRSQKPLVLLGGGAKGAGEEVSQLAEQLAAPVLNTVNAKGVYNGKFALGGSPSIPLAQGLMEQADLLVAIATELGETDYDLLMGGTPNVHASMIRIDIDAEQARMNAKPEIVLLGEAKSTLQQLLGLLNEAPTRQSWVDIESFAEQKAQYPHMHKEFAAIFACIDKAVPDAIVVGDSTRPTYYASWMWERPAPRRYFHCVSGFGTLGYALPAAIGAYLADRHRPIVAIAGDGGVMFSLAELAVAVHEQLPIKLIIWDNEGYQEIAQSLAAQGIDNEFTQFSGPDFCLLAQGFGAAIAQPNSLEELYTALVEDTQKPQVIWMRESRFITESAGEWY